MYEDATHYIHDSGSCGEGGRVKSGWWQNPARLQARIYHPNPLAALVYYFFVL